MMHLTIDETTTEDLTTPAEEQFLVQTLHALRPRLLAVYRAVQAGTASLQALEHVSRRFGVDAAHAVMETYWQQAVVPVVPARGIACGCGGIARYHSLRTAQVQTSVGMLRLTRPYYYCTVCRHGQIPLDVEHGVCAGGVSVELNRLLACFGAQDSFPQAVQTAATALFVTVSPTTCRLATESLGSALAEQEAHIVAAAFDPRHPTLPAGPAQAPDHLYISADGVFIEEQTGGKTELKIGAVYTTHTVPSTRHPGTREVRTDTVSYIADHSQPVSLGRALWVEAVRRGLVTCAVAIFIADGAHWLWDLADEHFPGAVQILDWYHAMSYVWAVANARFGEGTPQARAWAKRQQKVVWAGEALRVVATCTKLTDSRPTVQAAVHDLVSYYTYHQHRMAYPTYRARGFQIGSGTIESGCKRVVSLRHRQPGMAWTIPGARAVAKVRAWLLSDRWAEAETYQPVPLRSYCQKVA